MWFFAIPAAIRTGVSMVPAFVWKWLAIAVGLLCIFFYGEIKGEQKERVKWELASKEAKQAANDQDLQAEKEGREQDLQITNALTEQKKVDDATIETLKAQLAKRPAGAACQYDKSNADPDEQPAGSVRDKSGKSRARAGNKKSP